MIRLTLASLALLAVAGCATTETAEAPVTTADTAKVETVVASASERKGPLGGRQAPDTRTETSEDGEEIICKTEVATGSRLRKNEICGTAAQWDAKREANRRKLNTLTGDSASSRGNR